MLKVIREHASIDQQIANTTREILSLCSKLEEENKPTRNQLDNWLQLVIAHQSYLDPGPKEIEKFYPEILSHSADIVWAAVLNCLRMPPWFIRDLGGVIVEIKLVIEGRKKEKLISEQI